MFHTIGNTPVVRLRRLAPPGSAEIFVKIEGQNPTGSYKDRGALAMIRGCLARGELARGRDERDGPRVPRRAVECTGGSTGTSVAFVCAAEGIPVTIISSDAFARQKLDSMAAFGAELLIEPSRGGKVTPDLWPRMRERAAGLVRAGSHHWLDQFNNPDMLPAYTELGEELVRQVGPPIDAFCACVGTAAMIVGAGAVVRDRYPDARIVAVEPETSAVLSGGPAGDHTIDGTAAGFVPPMFDRAVVPEVMALPEREGRDTARRLAKEEGVFAGTSSGMNVLAALRLARELGPGRVVATVACDTGYKYLDEGLHGPRPNGRDQPSDGIDR